MRHGHKALWSLLYTNTCLQTALPCACGCVIIVSKRSDSREEPSTIWLRLLRHFRSCQNHHAFRSVHVLPQLLQLCRIAIRHRMPILQVWSLMQFYVLILWLYMKVKEKCTLCLGVVSIQDAVRQTLTNLYFFDPLLIAKVYKFSLFICALMCP